MDWILHYYFCWRHQPSCRLFQTTAMFQVTKGKPLPLLILTLSEIKHMSYSALLILSLLVKPFKRKLLRSTSVRCCLLGPTSWFNFWHPSVDKIPKYAIQIKTVEQYSVVVLFSMLYKVILAFETKSKILTIQLNAFKVIPFNCIAHPFCASFFA